MEIIQALRLYVEGRINLKEFDETLSDKGIHGGVKGREFTGYDYTNQAWIIIRLS